MKSRFDFAIGYEGGTFSTFEILDEHDRPDVGDVIIFHIEGKKRKVVITKILDGIVYLGAPRIPVHGRVADAS